MLLGTTNLLSGVRTKAFNRSLNDFFIVLNCQVVKWIDFFANPVLKIQVSTAVIWTVESMWRALWISR